MPAASLSLYTSRNVDTGRPGADISKQRCEFPERDPASKIFKILIHRVACLYPLQCCLFVFYLSLIDRRATWGATGAPLACSDMPTESPEAPQCIRTCYTHSGAAGIDPNPPNPGLYKKLATLVFLIKIHLYMIWLQKACHDFDISLKFLTPTVNYFYCFVIGIRARNHSTSEIMSWPILYFWPLGKILISLEARSRWVRKTFWCIFEKSKNRL